jgi:hypothetical protein
MRLYALGALARYEPFYGGLIRQVRTTIVQPRIRDTPDSETLTVDELKAWGESVKPIAQKAFHGQGEFVSGEHCRFCRGKAQCRARADAHTALEDFKDCALRPSEAFNGTKTKLLTHTEIGDLLVRGKTLVEWYGDLQEYALGALLKGLDIPGWKAVAGRSVRAFTDTDAALAAVIASGYDEAVVYERKPKSLAELEKLMGKADFEDKVGAYVFKPQGKPALALLSDKREPYRGASGASAADDFADAGFTEAKPGEAVREVLP